MINNEGVSLRFLCVKAVIILVQQKNGIIGHKKIDGIIMVAIIERNRDFKFLTNKELLEQAKINSKNRELLCRRHLIYLLSKWLLPEKLT